MTYHYEQNKLKSVDEFFNNIAFSLQKKQSDSSDYVVKNNENQLLLVKRNQAYLKSHAFSHGKKQDLLCALKKMYQALENGFLRDEKMRPVSLGSLLALIPCWPVEPSSFWLSSRFGPRKKKDGAQGFHKGIDLAALHGTPVKTISAGRVCLTDFSQIGFGNRIEVDHGNGIKTRYAHLSEILVMVNQKVLHGQCIGRVGATGHVRVNNGDRKSASHLHFEVLVDGKQIDPLLVLA